jgi:hypothetical protein
MAPLNGAAPEVENWGSKRMSSFARQGYFTPSLISFKPPFFLAAACAPIDIRIHLYVQSLHLSGDVDF